MHTKIKLLVVYKPKVGYFWDVLYNDERKSQAERFIIPQC